MATNNATNNFAGVDISFFAHMLSPVVANMTGDGTIYNPIIYDFADSNSGSYYSTTTGIFIAPIGGMYEFTVTTALKDIDSTNTSGEFYIASNMYGTRAYALYVGNIYNFSDGASGVVGRVGMSNTIVIPVSAGEEISSTIVVSGSLTANVSFANYSAATRNSFCGRFLHSN